MSYGVIEVYTDGGARGNGEANCISAWAYTLKSGELKKEDKGVVIGATNNQMEMTAIIKALQAIKKKDAPIKIYSDSAYCINGITSWVHTWKKKGWINSKKQPVENKELWMEMDKLVSQCSSVEFIKVKGHADNVGNIRVDELVNIAMDEATYRANSDEDKDQIVEFSKMVKKSQIPAILAFFESLE